MGLWFPLYQTRARHPKTLRLSALLKISRREACGLLDDLWTWALEIANKDGSLPAMADEEIAVALDFPPKKGNELMKAFVAAGWIDRNGPFYALHNWENYGGKMNVRREKDAEYQRAKRSGFKPELPEPDEQPQEEAPKVDMTEADKPKAAKPKKAKAEQAPFVKPTLEQVTEYCRERKNSVNPERWMNHYTSNGWMVGKVKMQDWKSAVRTWENDTPKAPPSKPSAAKGYAQREYSEEALNGLMADLSGGKHE